MPSKKFNKICTICGEKAIGFNFCAISCESCKAFFRRNASKLDEYKCPFSDNCRIDQITRKFCRKCRLVKCFAVGMKQEWILSDEERELRRIKIEANKRGSKRMSDTSGESHEPEVSLSKEVNNSDTNSCDTVENISDEEIITNIMQIEEFLTQTPNTTDTIPTTVYDTQIQCSSLLPYTIEQSTVMPYPSHIYTSDQTLDEISNTTYQKAVELELCVIPIPRPVEGSNELNEVECNRLIEIFNATLSFRKPQFNPNLIFGKTEELTRVFTERLEVFSQKFVNATKSFNSFNSLCQNDQIALIKSATLEVLFMRTALYYDCMNEQWTFFCNDETAISFKLDVLQGMPLYQGDKSVYQLFRNYSRKITREWDNDPFILDLLMTIILFNPDRPNIVHKEPIKLQQQLYMYLLQRYLQTKYTNSCEYKVKFLKILDVIQDLQQLHQIQKQYYKQADPNNLGPLSREILDMKTNAITNTYIML